MRGNQLIDLPSSIVHLSNLQVLDLEKNDFSDKRYYNTTDLTVFFAFLSSREASVLSKNRKGKSRSRKVEGANESFLNPLSSSKPPQVMKPKKRLYRLVGKHTILIRQVRESSCSNTDSNRLMLLFLL